MPLSWLPTTFHWTTLPWSSHCFHYSCSDIVIQEEPGRPQRPAVSWPQNWSHVCALLKTTCRPFLFSSVILRRRQSRRWKLFVVQTIRSDESATSDSKPIWYLIHLFRWQLQLLQPRLPRYKLCLHPFPHSMRTVSGWRKRSALLSRIETVFYILAVAPSLLNTFTTSHPRVFARWSFYCPIDLPPPSVYPRQLEA